MCLGVLHAAVVNGAQDAVILIRPLLARIGSGVRTHSYCAERRIGSLRKGLATSRSTQTLSWYARTRCNAIERKCSQSGEESRALCRSQRKHHCSPLIATSMPDLVFVCADRVLCSSQAAFFRWLEHALPFQLLLLVVFLYSPLRPSCIGAYLRARERIRQCGWIRLVKPVATQRSTVRCMPVNRLDHMAHIVGQIATNSCIC